MSEIINYGDFAKLAMRVGLILEVERVPRTDKLYKLKVNVGLEEPIQIVSSLVPFYTEEELLNKKIVVLTNLKPTKFAGEESNGMLLCAETDDESKCVLLTVDKDMEPGSIVC